MKKNTLPFTAITFLFILFSVIPITAQKITAEDVIAKHLDSIGTKEKREAIKNQFVLADVLLTAKSSTTSGTGKGVILSEGGKNLWAMNFNLNEYPQDRYVFDGKETKVGYTNPGVRSVLGGFILSYKELLREGLMGGTLTSSWVLLNLDGKKGKVSFDGTKKIDGQETYVLSFTPRGGSDLNIKMFFDTKKFRHLRSEYNRTVSAGQALSINSSARQTSSYYKLVEDFSDFQNINGITIPKVYKISYSYINNSLVKSATNQNQEFEWTFTVTNFSINQDIDQNSFMIDAK